MQAIQLGKPHPTGRHFTDLIIEGIFVVNMISDDARMTMAEHYVDRFLDRVTKLCIGCDEVRIVLTTQRKDA